MCRTRWLLVGILPIVFLLIVGCAGPQGEAGPVGPAGPAGPFGPAGPAGEDASASQTYVGSERCGSCHEGEYGRFLLTGHANALHTIDGAPPTLPYDQETGGIATPPAGYEWTDISYVIGGFGWMARFVDQEGYLIIGEAAQYNFANDDLETDAEWVAFHSGEQRLFDCGRCHTTGYAEQGHQNNLDGVDGTWVFEGIQCEKCHGPGSRHSDDPQGVRMVVDRTSQLCGKCHLRGERATIDAFDGFEEHNQQFSDLYNSQHFALSCVTCHDPHASSQYMDEALNPTQGISQVCESCHWQEVVVQNVSRHGRVQCVDCHMPPMAKSAVSIPAQFKADIRSHQFAINPDVNAPQFNEDETAVMPYLTLTYACGQCHNGEFADVKEPEAMTNAARGYHTYIPPTPMPTETAVPETAIEATPTATP